MDFYIKNKNNDEHIIEIKYLEEPKDSSGKYPVPPTKPDEAASLREKMAPKAREALRQVTEKYTQSPERGPGRLIKVALVIARRTFVLAQFETLEREPVQARW
jgi:hypothetical protein